MSHVYFTSDLHFGHKNLCTGIRGMSAEESDALIISNWNKVVTKKDRVYVLGDFVMEKHNLIEQYIKQLNGDIVIVGGNHDDVRCCKEYMRLGIPVMGCLEYKGYICTHIPIALSEVKDLYRGNIHGHIHKQLGTTELPKQYYYNVNTEFHNYTPKLFSEIENEFTEIKILKLWRQ
jgi:calcineurin-like phosphoesterase family protein